MDRLTDKVRRESSWTVMFTDDIVICREQVEGNPEGWSYALERRGIKVSRSKIEYVCANERDQSETVNLQGGEVKKAEDFKYLGSTIQSNGERGIKVKKRVQTGCTKNPACVIQTISKAENGFWLCLCYYHCQRQTVQVNK